MLTETFFFKFQCSGVSLALSLSQLQPLMNSMFVTLKTNLLCCRVGKAWGASIVLSIRVADTTLLLTLSIPHLKSTRLIRRHWSMTTSGAWTGLNLWGQNIPASRRGYWFMFLIKSRSKRFWISHLDDYNSSLWIHILNM